MYHAKIKIVGAIIPGIARWIIAIPPGLKVGSSMHMTIVHILVLKVQKYLRAKGKELPPNLWLQSDNTTKECKNHAMLAYLSCLVAKGVFVSVSGCS